MHPNQPNNSFNKPRSHPRPSMQMRPRPRVSARPLIRSQGINQVQNQMKNMNIRPRNQVFFSLYYMF